MQPQAPEACKSTPRWRKLVAPCFLLLLLALAYALGLWDLISLDAIAAHRTKLSAITANHPILAALVYFLVYVIAVAISIPGATLLTVLGGFMFGLLEGGLLALFAATCGATIVFEVAKSTLGDFLTRKAGPWLGRMQAGFAADAFNYLLFLRLVPAFPFWLVNIAPALAKVRLRVFAAATLLGIIPGTFAVSSVGAGLDSVISKHEAMQAQCLAANPAAACKASLSLTALLTPQLLLAFMGLGFVALIPVAIKKWKARHAV